MNRKPPSMRLFCVTGGLAVLCGPAVLLAERYGWSQAPFHVTALVSTVICFLSSIAFIWSTRGEPFGGRQSLALVACTLSAAWLAFVVHVMLTFDLSGMD